MTLISARVIWARRSSVFDGLGIVFKLVEQPNNTVWRAVNLRCPHVEASACSSRGGQAAPSPHASRLEAARACSTFATRSGLSMLQGRPKRRLSMRRIGALVYFAPIGLLVVGACAPPGHDDTQARGGDRPPTGTAASSMIDVES